MGIWKVGAGEWRANRQARGFLTERPSHRFKVFNIHLILSTLAYNGFAPNFRNEIKSQIGV
jgi:hypothetical protein